MNSLQDLWGQASTQLAPAAAMAGTGLTAASSFLKSGTKAMKESFKDVAGGVAGMNFSTGKQHTFRDNRDGRERVVTEVSLIAEGGFGAVTLVRDTRTGTEYALKKIVCQEGVQVASTIDAAEREAKILQKLPPHKNIVQCLGYCIDGGGGSGTVKLLLELCTGGHLLDFMDRRNGQLAAKDVLGPMIQIADAVSFLHRQKPPIQHRDLKVENVLQAETGTWKLCDFGSCSTECFPPEEMPRKKLMKLQEDVEKTVTMLYRPPELADIEMNPRKGYAINEQVDMWMLGCILFTLAFYRHPFQDSANAMAICNAKYFVPQDHPMARSAKLVGLIHWLLAPDPKDRPTSARLCELLADLAKCKYADFYASMPRSVQEKIERFQKLFTARKDTGDIPEGLVLDSGAPKGAARARQTQSQAEARGPAGNAGAASLVDGGFDVNFALTANAPSASASQNGRASGYGKPAAAPKAASASAEDLLGFDAPAPAAAPAQARAAPSSTSDLLDFGFSNSIPNGGGGGATASPAVASSVSGGNLLDFGFDPLSAGGGSTPSTSPASNPGAPPYNGGGFGTTAAPTAPFGTFPAAAPPSGGFGCDFADFADFASAPPPPVAAVPAAAPINTPGCGGAARASQPQSVATAQKTAQADLLDLF